MSTYMTHRCLVGGCFLVVIAIHAAAQKKLTNKERRQAYQLSPQGERYQSLSSISGSVCFETDSEDSSDDEQTGLQRGGRQKHRILDVPTSDTQQITRAPSRCTQAKSATFCWTTHICMFPCNLVFLACCGCWYECPDPWQDEVDDFKPQKKSPCKCCYPLVPCCYDQELA